MLRFLFQIIGNMNTNINQISIDENSVKQLCNMVQAKFQKNNGCDIEGMADCEKTLKVIVTARQGIGSEFYITDVVQQRQLSSRAVTVSHVIDTGSIILSIAALSLQVAMLIVNGVIGDDASSSSAGDSIVADEVAKWMSIITMALALIASSKNQVLDKLKK